MKPKPKSDTTVTDPVPVSSASPVNVTFVDGSTRHDDWGTRPSIQVDFSATNTFGRGTDGQSLALCVLVCSISLSCSESVHRLWIVDNGRVDFVEPVLQIDVYLFNACSAQGKHKS